MEVTPRVVSTGFFDAIKLMFSFVWNLLNELTVPGTSIKAIHLILGSMGFIVVISFIVKILNNGDMHGVPGLFLGSPKDRPKNNKKSEG